MAATSGYDVTLWPKMASNYRFSSNHICQNMPLDAAILYQVLKEKYYPVGQIKIWRQSSIEFHFRVP